MSLHFDLKIPFCLGSLCPNVRRESKLDILKGKEPSYEHVTSVIQSVYFRFCFCFRRVSCKLKLYLFIIVADPKAVVIKLMQVIAVSAITLYFSVNRDFCSNLFPRKGRW